MGIGVSKEEQDIVNDFVQAAAEGDVDTVKKYMQELNGKNDAGDTALHVAASAGQLDVVKELLAKGSALENDAKDNDDVTPLMLAAAGGYFEIVFNILKSGADPNLYDRMGWSALHHAASNGHSVVVSFLLGKVNARTIYHRDSSGCSPLWLAASSCDPESVRLLLLHGSDPDEINDEGVSVVEIAEDAEISDPTDQERVNLILTLLHCASNHWVEMRLKTGKPEFEDRNIRAPKVLEGTLDEGPSIPIQDESQPFINEDAIDEELDDDDMLTIRESVKEILRLEDPFVETYFGKYDTV